MSMSRRRVNWSELPTELLTSIADRLETRFDTWNFQSVCKNWNASTAFCVHHPQNLLSPIFPYKFSISESYFRTPLDTVHAIVLVPCSIYLVRSSINSNLPPWLCTVEELNPGKFHLRRPHRQFPDRVPVNFNVSFFQVNEVGRFYTIGSTVNEKFYRVINKVILIVDPNCKTLPTVDDHNVVMLSNKDGGLQLVSMKNRRTDKITGSNVRKYDDVVNFKGSIFAIDRKGRAYTLAYNRTKPRKIVSQVLGEGSGSDRKKRLVVSDTGELYLVHRCPPYTKGTFKLYQLNEARNTWDDVDGVGVDRILLVTPDGCFLAMAKDFPGLRGNCIVFRRGQFMGYNHGPDPDLEIFGSSPGLDRGSDIGVFNFGDGNFTPLDWYSGDSSLLWPLPDWLLSDTDAFNKVSRAEIKKLRNFFDSATLESNMKVETVSRQGTRPGLLPNARGRIIIDIDSFLEITPKAVENTVTQAKFQGVDVCSDLVPILGKIWEKYGNVVQDHAAKSDGLLKWALESLAKMVMIIQTNSIESLNELQASFLSATLKDLQYLHIRVDWLAPFIEEVSASNLGCDTAS